MQPYFLGCSFLIFTRSLPAFGRAYASTIPLHFVTVIRSLNAPFHSAKSSLFRFTAFQPYYVCRPQFFQRLLFRTAIGVCSAIALHLNKERLRLTLFFPRRFTLIATTFRYVPSLHSRVYGGCSIAATPPLRSSYISL